MRPPVDTPTTPVTPVPPEAAAAPAGPAQSAPPADVHPAVRSRAVADALVVAAAALLTFGLASWFELSEAFARWLHRYEPWQADELPFMLLVAAMGMAWYAMRRRHEARQAVALHRQARGEVAQLLGRNRHLAQQLIAVQESERAALARELHDELGQRCTAIRIEAAVIKGAVAAQRVDVHSEVSSAAQRIANSAGALHDMVRGMLRRLRPAELDELGLLGALQALCESWEARSGVACAIAHEGPLDGLPDVTAVAVYRIVQEALSNVMRHARARHAYVHLACSADAGLLVQVRDDGAGMDALAHPRGLGLLGAGERAAALGGRLHTESWPGAGTTLVAHLPASAVRATPTARSRRRLP